jgi:serine phosphatase RsbU (regulator of sigma subunit)
VVTYEDVTERRRMEDERAAAVTAREEAAAVAAAAAEEAERAGRHLMLLGDINLAMTSTLDTDEAVQRFADLVVPLLADWCVVSVIDPDGTRRDVGRAHKDPALVETMHRYADLRVATNNATAPVPLMLRDPRPVIFPELTEDVVRSMVPDDDARTVLAPLRPAAAAGFPLIARGEVIGGFTLINEPERGAHTAAELRTAEIASRRAALALDNARLAAANQQVAERLQLSLLSPPVQPEDLQLVVRYRPATQGMSIGGDWYDAFQQPDGDTVVVIGDVMGHDIEAAAAMGQVKTLVRAIAFDRLEEPAGVLRRVDHALVGLQIPTMATALVCRLEQIPDDGPPSGRRLRWSTAGHPEPMLRQPDGTVVDLTAPVGPPLGIGWLGPRVDGLVPMAEGSTLLLFTDGLFERRGASLDDGRALVRDLLAREGDRPLDEFCDVLLGEMLGEGVEDDVAVLAVRAHRRDDRA